MGTEKRALTEVPVLDTIAERWSPRSFRIDHELSLERLRGAFEAARWAPSSGNTQPWRFILTRRGSDSFARVVDALRPGNQTWAPSASALIVNVAQLADDTGREYPWAEYDLGQAVAYFTLQAHSEGLFVHQMGGFDREAIHTDFGLTAQQRPISITAVGLQASADQLPDQLREREMAPRRRRRLDELLLPGSSSSSSSSPG